MQDTTAPASAQPARLHWGWILIGVVLGATLISVFVAIVWNELPKPAVSMLVGALTFVLTGLFVGFFSPGETMLEPALAGIVLAALTGIVLGIVVDLQITPLMAIVAIPSGFVLALAGGWVGELMQGTLDPEREPVGIQWPWIAAGIILGAILNAYFVFVGRALFGFGPAGILWAFALSFVVAGLFVGLFSPGVTILEPALAGIGLVAVDVLITTVGFEAPFPVTAIAVAGIGAFVLSLIGGWIGEKLQALGRRRTVP